MLNVSVHLALDAFRLIEQAGVTMHDRSEVPAQMVESWTWTPAVHIHPRSPEDALILAVHAALDPYLRRIEHPTLFPR